jgi:hypothetical protein
VALAPLTFPAATIGVAMAQPQYQQAGYQQPQYQQGSGGMLQNFLSGGFGRAIMTGAGFGIGDDIINKIF